jgi:hypothetical protein
MKIAANEVLANPTHVSHLPPSWGTLYELATLPTEVLEAKIADGTITPDTERKDVARLKAPEDEDEAEDVVGEASAPEAEDEDEDEETSDAEEEVEGGDAEELHQLRRKVAALQSENEELRHEREQLRLRVDELEHALMSAGRPKRKRGRPPGSKNKPKVLIEDGSDCGPIPESLRRAS